MVGLHEKKCVPCEGGTPTLTREQISEYQKQLQTPWEVVESNLPAGRQEKIHREFVFKDFIEAIEFVNNVAELAEKEDHHPDIHISYKKVTIELWTHAIGGLSENDFILASKIEKIQ